MLKRIAAAVGVIALVTALGVFVATSAFAQTTTPPNALAPTGSAPANPEQGTPRGPGGWGGGFEAFGGGGTATFDAEARALNLTPTQLFEQLHSGQTLSEIAQTQGVDIQAVQAAVKAVQDQAAKDQIAQAVTDGRMTQEQADWLLQGLAKGWTQGLGGRGMGGPGMGGGMMRGGPGGPPPGDAAAAAAPATSTQN